MAEEFKPGQIVPPNLACTVLPTIPFTLRCHTRSR